MRIALHCIGRLKDGPDRALFDRYWKRLEAQGRSLGLGPVRLVELPESRDRSAAVRQEDEAQRLLKGLSPGTHLIALDERGKSLTSDMFASLVGRLRDSGAPELALAIGGPDGHGAALMARADAKLCLGPMTMPHGLARIVLAEQLYRAATILAGHPYHRA